MSKNIVHTFECPHCGNKQETIVWLSVNVALNPELREKLLRAEINLFVCQNCAKTSRIEAPLLYHDMRLHYCVQYYPPESLSEADFFPRFNPDGSRRLPDMPDGLQQPVGYIGNPHVVFDMNELVRYVAFREGIRRAMMKK